MRAYGQAAFSAVGTQLSLPRTTAEDAPEDIEAQQRVQQELARLAAGSPRVREETLEAPNPEPISEMSDSAGHPDTEACDDTQPQDRSPPREPALANLAHLGPPIPAPALLRNDGSPPMHPNMG